MKGKLIIISTILNSNYSIVILAIFACLLQFNELGVESAKVMKAKHQNQFTLLNNARDTLNEIPFSQTASLMELYDATTGTNWNNNKNWGYGDPCANSWFGIYCDAANSTVLQVVLPSNNLVGMIPQTISQLVDLQVFEIQENLVKGNLPSSISELYELERFNVSNNQFTGAIPDFSQMESLTSIQLSFNNFSGSVPSSLLTIINLQTLELNFNQLSGSLPSDIYLPNLETILMNNNQLEGTIPSSLFQSYSIQTVNLGSNKFTGSIPSSFPQVFHEINLSHNQLGGIIPSSIWHLPKFLDLSYNQLTGSISPSLSNSAISLKLSNNQLTGTLPSALCYRSLETVQLDQNLITGTIPSCVWQVGFKELDISSNDLTGGIYTSNDLSLFKYLNLRNNSLSGNLPYNFGQQLYMLEYLDLSFNEFGGNIPSLNNMPVLYYLNLQNNKFTGFLEMSILPSSLKEYNLTNNQFYCPVPIECGELGNTLCLPCKENSFTLLGSLSHAILLFINGDNENATKIMEGNCNNELFQHNYATSGLQNISCQWANNLQHGNSFFSSRDNSIPKLPWSGYNSFINYQINNVLVPYESLLQEFKVNFHNYNQMQNLTETVMNYCYQESLYWNDTIVNVTSLLSANENMMFDLRTQINYLLINDLSDEFTLLQYDVNQTLYEIKQNLNEISDSQFFLMMEEMGEITLGMTLSLCGVPTDDIIVFNAINIIDVYFETYQSAIHIVTLQDAVKSLEPISEALYFVSSSLSIMADIYSDLSNEIPPPELLPSLPLNHVSYSIVEQSLRQLAQQLIHSNNQQSVRNAVNQFSEFVNQLFQTSLNYYSLLMNLQNYESERNIALNSYSPLNYLLNIEKDVEEAFIAAYFTALQFKVGATFRILVEMLYLQRQYNYYSLSNYSFSLPLNPNSSQILNAQQELYNSITSYLQNNQQLEQLTMNFTLSTEYNNVTFTQLWETGISYFVISLPDTNFWKEYGRGFYYQVNIVDIEVYPYPIVNNRFSTINIGLTQLGDSFFLDEHGQNWNFTSSIYDYIFKFDVNTKCPLSKPFVDPKVDYVHYSPYGIWQIQFSENQLDISLVDRIELYFTLTVNYVPSIENFPIWGRYPYLNEIVSNLPKC